MQKWLMRLLLCFCGDRDHLLSPREHQACTSKQFSCIVVIQCIYIYDQDLCRGLHNASFGVAAVFEWRANAQLAARPYRHLITISLADATGRQVNIANIITESRVCRYVMRRLRHSVGEVTCLSIEEHVSLPADALLAVRFESAAPAQAFLSIKKL